MKGVDRACSYGLCVHTSLSESYHESKVGPEVKKETAIDSHQYSFTVGSLRPFCTSLLWNATNDFYIATTFPLFSFSLYTLPHLALLTPLELRKLNYEVSVLCTCHKPECQPRLFPPPQVWASPLGPSN